MLRTYRIREFDSFTRKVHIDSPAFVELPADTFDKLERFVLENETLNEDAGAGWEFFSLSVKHGTKVISAKNYVGLVTLNDGTTIEIMPKIDSADDRSTRHIFLDMLRTVKDIPYKASTDAAVLSTDITLYEVFIRMFLNETNTLVKKGLKFGYVNKESNEQFLKGRLDFNQQIKRNALHKERFYISYDEFEANRPENKLIKATLEYVWERSHDGKNRRICRRLIDIMDEIEASTDYAGDFSRYTVNRNMNEYEVVMKWCRVFLMNKSFSAIQGKDVAFALLFPMEQLFEGYVVAKIKRYLDRNIYSVYAQDRRYYLFDNPKRFSMRPDIVVENRETGKRVVLDTKWKLLSPTQHNYGISQADMYQMYAYHKKYYPDKVLLLYPYNQSFSKTEQKIVYEANDGVKVQVLLLDMLKAENGMSAIKENIGI